MTDLRTAVKLLDGPEGGNAILGYEGEAPDDIAVFRTRAIAVNTLVCCPVGQYDGPHPGDHVYRKVSRSDLLDRADWQPHKGLMPGCAYVFIRTVEDGG